MQIKPLVLCLCLALAAPVAAETFVIPFSDIRQEIDTSGGDPDVVIRAYLAGLIRDELDAQGFNVDGGLVFGEIPLDEITERIADHCYVPTPYKVHTDATTATVSIADTSSITIGLDSIRSIDVLFDLSGLFSTEADAWVRWGQDVPFIGSCKTISTDNGWVALDLPFAIDLDVHLDLDPVYDAEQVAIVVDKQAVVSGSAELNGGNLQHDFGTASPTDIVLAVFEDQLLEELGSQATEAFADEIVRLNYRLDGLDESGAPDPTIEAFNAPSTFFLSTDEEDQDFIRELLAELGVPELVLAMIDERGVEILLQLVLLEGAERDAYLASLGAEIGCDALLGTYQVALDATPLYTNGAQGCEVADPATGSTGGYFSDAACSNEVAFSPTDELAYCQAQFGPTAEATLGNAASWVPDTNQPGDALPGVASLPWTLVPTTEIDLGTVSLEGNAQPYMKQLSYKTITNTGRGTGTCELEMRVYKSDIVAQGLRPLIALHGGTWAHRGSSFMGLEAGISQFTERGFVVFAPFYRLVGESDGNVECNGASWHEVTEDVEHALDWVNQNGAALGAVQEPVSLFGQSAGAHLSAWLAANRSAEVRKALLYYGPTDAMEFLEGAVPSGGPYESYRRFGLRALERLFGAYSDTSDIDLRQINFAGLTVAQLSTDWATLIPDTVFDLSLADPQAAPVYVERCATSTAIDLGTINLAMPPAELLSCMKQDLSDFLIRNSFNHQLADEAVPVSVVHGSGDTIVPHEQAVNLCGAIDDSVLAPDAIDPLTVYSCGIQSKIHVVRDADHALDLGVCLEPLCPAGAPGSDTRAAAVTAINASFAWLLLDDRDGDGVPDSTDAFPDDPAESVDTDNDGTGNNADTDDDNDGVPDADELLAGTDPLNADTDGDTAEDGVDNCPVINNPTQFDYDADGVGDACDASQYADVTAFGDITGDGKPDVAGLLVTGAGNPAIGVYSGATGDWTASIDFGNDDWQALALATIADADQDGTSGDPAVAMLIVNRVTNKIRVESRRLDSAVQLSSIAFFNHKWRAIDAVVIDDLDGNGSTNDTAIAVLAERRSDGRIQLQLRDFDTGDLVANTVYLTPSWSAVAAAVANRDDMPPLVGVIAENASNGGRTLQAREAGSGTPDGNTGFLGSAWKFHDVSVNHDANGDGVIGDTVWQVLATRDSDNVIRVQSRAVHSDALDANTVILNAGWEALRLDTAADIDGNGAGELAITAIRRSDGLRRIHIKDYGTGATTTNVAP